MSEQQKIRPTSERKSDEEETSDAQDELTNEEEDFFLDISKHLEEKIGIAKVFKQKGGQ